jgi:hypothetical protein
MITVTVTETTMTVIAHGEVPDEEWRKLMYQHNLQDRMIDHVDYRLNRSQDGSELVHYWRFAFAPQIAEPKAVSL